jgi:hypothetical protein
MSASHRARIPTLQLRRRKRDIDEAHPLCVQIPATPAGGNTNRCNRNHLNSLPQERDDLLARHRGKPFQEIIDGLATLQVVEQRRHRHPRAVKHNRAAHHVTASRDHRLSHGIIVRVSDRSDQRTRAPRPLHSP